MRISGRIEIAQNLSKLTRDTDVIFLIARAAEGGPPVAALRLTGKSYPYLFTIAAEHLMLPDSKLESPLNLSVRVDKDGDAMTKKVGDLTGSFEKNPVSLRSENIVITVSEVLR